MGFFLTAGNKKKKKKAELNKIKSKNRNQQNQVSGCIQIKQTTVIGHRRKSKSKGTKSRRRNQNRIESIFDKSPLRSRATNYSNLLLLYSFE